MKPSKVQITGAQAMIGTDQLTPFAPNPLLKILGTVIIFVEQIEIYLIQFNNASPQFPVIDFTSPMRFPLQISWF